MVNAERQSRGGARKSQIRTRDNMVYHSENGSRSKHLCMAYIFDHQIQIDRPNKPLHLRKADIPDYGLY